MWSVKQWEAAVLSEMEAITDSDAEVILERYKGMQHETT
jgi:hypothetical protein